MANDVPLSAMPGMNVRQTPCTFDAWLVDLDGTLYRQTWVRLAMAANLLLGGRAAIPVLRAFRRAQEQLRHECQEDCDDLFALQIRYTAERLGLETVQVQRLVQDWMIQRPGPWLRRFRRGGLLAEIRRFRERGGKTALVSDYPASEKLQSLGAADLFDIIVASGEPGGPKRWKPAPDGYLIAAERLDAAPAQCLVIGDRDDADGEAARRAGMAFRRIGGRRARG